MIPLISIVKFITTIFFIFIAYQSYKSWKKEEENETLKYFFKAFLLATISFSIFTFFPFIKSLYLIQSMFYLHDILVSLITFCFISIFLIFLNWQKFQKIIYWSILLGILILIPFYIKYFAPATVFYYDFLGLRFIDWAPTLPPLIRVSLFGIMGGIAFFFIIFFLRKTLSLTDSYLKIRGIFFVVGLIFLWQAGMFSVVYGGFRPTSFFKELFHILFSLLTSAFFLLFILYKKNK